MIGRYLRGLTHALVDGWNRFWFSLADPAPLAVIRIAIGLLLVYSHAVWALNSDDSLNAVRSSSDTAGVIPAAIASRR